MARSTNHADIRIGTLARMADGVDYLRQVLPHGFESFQLHVWQHLPAMDLKDFSDRLPDVLGERATISAIGLYGNVLQDAQTAADFARCIDLARDFGCSTVCGFTGAIDGRPLPESLPAFKKVWSELARRAEDRGVRIGFEACDMGGYWQHVYMNIAHADVAWEMMFNEVPSPALGLEWEPCHPLASFVDPLPQLRKWLPKVVHVHGKDATIDWNVIREHGIRSGRQYHQGCFPGCGQTNWTDVFTILRMGNWSGTLDIEGWHDPVFKDELEMTGQVRALAYLKECRGGPFVPNPRTA